MPSSLPPAGVLNIDKPTGMTSHDVVASVRRIIGHKRVGHAGTLDPLATGVLLVCVGAATRISDYLQAGRKTYRARLRLGAATSTYDSEGEVMHTAPVPELNPDIIIAHMQSFIGEIQQIPPMYSAVKQGGTPLYKLARAGLEVERKPRQVLITELSLEAWEPPEATLRIVCSAGTYVRSLVHDLGLSLGTYAHVTALRRLASGDWRVEDAVPLRLLQEQPQRWRDYLTPLAHISLGLPTVYLEARYIEAFAYGRRLSLALDLDSGECQVKGPDGRILGIALYDAELAQLSPRKVFIDPANLATL